MNLATAGTIRSLPPVVSDSSRILVLGSMPGVRSLELGQYYSHPRNIFWQIVQRVLGIAASLSYRDRTAQLTDCGYALWDVAASCEREGSLDTNIKNAEPNDFIALFSKFPQIESVCFNGAEAAKLWARRVSMSRSDITFQTLPSTSPANASMTFPAKCRAWETALKGKDLA